MPTGAPNAHSRSCRTLAPEGGVAATAGTNIKKATTDGATRSRGLERRAQMAPAPTALRTFAAITMYQLAPSRGLSVGSDMPADVSMKTSSTAMMNLLTSETGTASQGLRRIRVPLRLFTSMAETSRAAMRPNLFGTTNYLTCSHLAVALEDYRKVCKCEAAAPVQCTHDSTNANIDCPIAMSTS